MINRVLVAVTLSLVSSIGLACTNAEADKAYDNVNDVFMSMTGATYLVLSCDEDCANPELFIEMADSAEVEKANAVFRDGFIFNGCQVQFKVVNTLDISRAKRVTKR